LHKIKSNDKIKADQIYKVANMYVSIGQASQIIGVSISTLRRWEVEKSFIPDFRTKGGHRRYKLATIYSEIINEAEIKNTTRKTIAYSRVSSSDQKLDLLRQSKRLEKHCQLKCWDYELISDLGSGLNYKKKGLNKLINLICTNQVSRLVLTHKDRLLRFGSPLLFKLCGFFNTEVVILEESKELSFEQELVTDVIELMTVFTARMHGKRSHKNKKVCAVSC
jgi:predicted site-specific integrase-resolvase